MKTHQSDPGSEYRKHSRDRRPYEHGVGTIKGVARKFGFHRQMVREAVGNPVPPARKIPEPKRPKLPPVIPFIEEMLEADRKAPRKQRHTAHRIWCRLKAEHPEAEIAESPVRRYVRLRKQEMSLARAEVFVPQNYYRWGQEGQRHAVARRITEAKFPRVKTLEDFHFDEAPIIPAAEIRKLAEGGYLSRSGPIIFLGETGTGKTHLAEC